jgi:hypothetical protein
MTQISPENPRKQEITGDFRASMTEKQQAVFGDSK